MKIAKNLQQRKYKPRCERNYKVVCINVDNKSVANLHFLKETLKMNLSELSRLILAYGIQMYASRSGLVLPGDGQNDK